MRHVKKILTIICICSLITVVSFSGGQLESQITVDGADAEFSVKADTPIAIYGNAALNATASAGNGTAGDPYIIENYVINASSAHGINISNTDPYFILRNCTVTGVPGYMYYGIYLDNVLNAQILNNTLQTTFEGIYLFSTQNSVLDSNIVTQSAAPNSEPTNCL